MVHASVLENRYASVAVTSRDDDAASAAATGSSATSAPQQRAERLETEKRDPRLKNCGACEDKDEALQRASRRIAELERQLQGKTAAVDILLSEVAATDAHLKSCGRSLRVMEAKVREMETEMEDADEAERKAWVSE